VPRVRDAPSPRRMRAARGTLALQPRRIVQRHALAPSDDRAGDVRRAMTHRGAPGAAGDARET